MFLIHLYFICNVILTSAFLTWHFIRYPEDKHLMFIYGFIMLLMGTPIMLWLKISKNSWRE